MSIWYLRLDPEECLLHNTTFALVIIILKSVMFGSYSLREKCPNTEFFLGRIFLYSVRMQTLFSQILPFEIVIFKRFENFFQNYYKCFSVLICWPRRNQNISAVKKKLLRLKINVEFFEFCASHWNVAESTSKILFFYKTFKDVFRTLSYILDEAFGKNS